MQSPKRCRAGALSPLVSAFALATFSSMKLATSLPRRWPEEGPAVSLRLERAGWRCREALSDLQPRFVRVPGAQGQRCECLLLWVGSSSRKAVSLPQVCWRCVPAVVWRRTAEALVLGGGVCSGGGEVTKSVTKFPKLCFLARTSFRNRQVGIFSYIQFRGKAAQVP